MFVHQTQHIKLLVSSNLEMGGSSSISSDVSELISDALVPRTIRLNLKHNWKL